MKNAYQKAGVSVEAGYEVVDRIKKHAKRTERLGVMGGLGGFGGAFDLSSLGVKKPVLVSGTDGVGTKLMLAIEADKHDTIGIDCVAMCVNDILAAGAEPLYFLDYLATGKTNPEQVEQIVAGVAEGCHQGNMALIGGETAEMPDMYADSDYDLAGFAVGVAEKGQLLTKEKVQSGDILIGLASSGIHSNGYSLVRKIFFKDNDFSLTDKLPKLGNQTLGDALLEPTRIYVKSVLPLIKSSLIHGISHVTGGGFVENLPRMLSENLAVEINKGTWEIPAIFSVMQEQGNLKEAEMYEIFNMGIGMVLAISPEKVSEVKANLLKLGETPYEIGRVITKESEEIVFIEELR
ncbi:MULTISPECIES: phosphoribosylformylglycinamidine cyclo-ligase [Vagococcus]|uniref:Phosphoribosylformylglycinamidine cyclo-ligase n=1 Tax=Vagococcus fluvialis bH819 TaxID=1255619 RepID=A0A1X6WK05_9ENTE|nr:MULTISPECIES: phosphoribosylformylglycinamidine cyclo-ligase [Vagococcus]SLM84641.1 Phosphoribosylformylglycinamidine cyclo-ligase [Vagococcus fluvialis bH819]HCM89895.1 phosphoribosylformylglycinamidine cyclo-ligase [Vagococcus sp.]